MNYLAHSKNDQGQTHSAKEHLAEVARLASGFAGDAAWSSEAAFSMILASMPICFRLVCVVRLKGLIIGLRGRGLCSANFMP